MTKNEKERIYQFIIENWSKMSVPEIAKAMNMDEKKIYNRIAVLRSRGVKLPYKRSPIDWKQLGEENRNINHP
jgi:predicted DNA-binding transcriptional regulator